MAECRTWTAEARSSSLLTLTMIPGGSVAQTRSCGIEPLPPRSCEERHALHGEVGLWGADM